MKKQAILNVWFEARQYGFIHETLPSGEIVPYFLHKDNIVSGTPHNGATVLFTPVKGTKGLLAVNAEVQS